MAKKLINVVVIIEIEAVTCNVHEDAIKAAENFVDNQDSAFWKDQISYGDYTVLATKYTGPDEAEILSNEEEE